jgi:hypothetical protein
MTKVKIYPSEGYGAHIRSIEEMATDLENTSIENIRIERLIDGESVALTQDPTGLGDANAIMVEFGPAVTTPAVALSAAGTITTIESGLYRIKLALQFGRTGAGGASIVMFRVLVNGTQAGRSVAEGLNTSQDIFYFENDTWVNLPAGATLQFQIMRDNAGNNSGGLKRIVASESWNDAPSAAIRVERYLKGV